MPTLSINGVDLYYEESGEGEPLVLIHGMGLDRRMWDAQIPVFSRHYRTVRYDVRGHGRSGRPRTGYRDERFEDLGQLLRHLRMTRAHLMGLSMGAEIAVGFTLRYPQMVRSLIAVDPYVEGYPFEQWDSKAVWMVARREGPAAAVAYWIGDPIFASAMQNAEVAARLRQMVAGHSGVMWADPGPYPRPRDPRPPRDFARLEEIAVPTLVLVGERDLPDFRAIAANLATRVPHARRIAIPHAGHISPMEQPEAVNEAALQFLSLVLL